MWKDTSYGAQKEQMEKAGLNPGLMYGMGGGGGQSNSITQGSLSGTSAGTAQSSNIGMGLQMELLKAQKENIEASTEKTKVETTKAAGVDTEKATAETSNIKAQESLTHVQRELEQVKASVARQTIKDSMQIIENTAKEGVQQIKLMETENKLNAAQVQDKINLLKNEVAKTAIETALKKAQIENTNQDTKNKIQEILESQERMKTMWGQLQVAWGQLENSNTGQRINWDNHLSNQNDDFKFIKDYVPTMLIPIGKGFGGGGYTPVRGFGK